jgi:NAD+ kinase
VGIAARSDIVDAKKTLARIINILKRCGAEVCIESSLCTGNRAPKIKRYKSCKEIDLLLVVGGDGTILRTVREMDDLAIPILSVNRGTIGFLAELSLHEADLMLPLFLMGKGEIEERSLLTVSAMRGSKTILESRVLNEAVVSQGAISRLIDLETYVRGDPLATFHADGLIVATPTGSTAYSLAAGGPIVHPQLRATILTPINPHSFNQKPIVLRADDDIELHILTKAGKYSDVQVSLTLDGQTYISLQRGDIVRIRTAKETVKFLRRKEETYFSTLRNKLKWAEPLKERIEPHIP